MYIHTRAYPWSESGGETRQGDRMPVRGVGGPVDQRDDKATNTLLERARTDRVQLSW